MRKLPKRICHVAIAIPPTCKANRDRIAGIMRYAQTRNWNTFFLFEHSASVSLDDLSDWDADGLITTPEELETIRRSPKGISAIVIANGRNNVPPEGCRQFGTVRCDNVEVGAMGARFLMHRHYEHFAFVGTPLPQAWSEERLCGFREELKRHGHDCAVYRSIRASGWGAEKNALSAFLKNLTPPCGILAAIDSRAKHVLDACREMGLDIPKQIGVVGVDNDEMTCEWTVPPLTSILPEFEQSGYRLAKLLDSLIDRCRKGLSDTNRTEFYHVSGIVERSSTLDMSGSLRIVSLARTYMRRNAASNISLADIAAASHCSVRVLQRKFKEATKHSPLAELHRLRIDIACKLLTTTHTHVDEIGHLCGFRSKSNLKRIFSRVTGCSMTDYRKRHQ